MNIKAELAAMEKMTTGELVERYTELTGQPVRRRHRAYLIRKIAWRLRANAEGDLSERHGSGRWNRGRRCWPGHSLLPQALTPQMAVFPRTPP